jgi:hypothetical protein
VPHLPLGEVRRLEDRLVDRLLVRLGLGLGLELGLGSGSGSGLGLGLGSGSGLGLGSGLVLVERLFVRLERDVLPLAQDDRDLHRVDRDERDVRAHRNPLEG